VVAPLAYLVARVAVGGAMVLAGSAPAGWGGLFSSLAGAWPGYLALLVLGLVVGLRPSRSSGR